VTTTADAARYAELRSSVAATLTVPARFNFVTDTFEQWSSDRLCMRWIDDSGGDRSISWKEMSDGASRVVNVLRARGVKKGDRVFIQVGRLPEWWETMLACLKMGAVAMPGTVMLTPKDIAYRLELSEPVAVVTEASIAPRFAAARGKPSSVKAYLAIGGQPDGWLDFRAERDRAPADAQAEPTLATDPAILYFTSGTTGFAKMVLHTHASYGIGHVGTARYWLDLAPEDLHWNISDTGWAKAAWSSFFSPFIAGAAQLVHNPTGAFSGKRVLDILAQYPITSMCGAPTIFRAVVLEDLRRWTFPSLRSCVAAGEPLNPEVIATWKTATGLEIRDGYGQTETCCLVGNYKGLTVKPGSMGKPSPGYDIAIIGDDAQPVAAGKEGDIGVRIKPARPVGLFREYWKNDQANRSSVRGDYYITGDRGVMDEDGYVWFVGRADDVILSAGYRIGPFEVESALLEHAAVAESAVVSSPDDIRGEIVKAFVVLKAGVTASAALAAELQDHCKKVTAAYKYPRKIDFVASLPKTVSGKIRRIELRNREWGRPIPASNERE
jgi:acetyl-CoA synthetase/medium-chain acyl-CoA synthetase